jgi:hypothetical protein
MEAQLYRVVYRLVMSIAHPRRPRVQFNDHIIVLVYLWSALHDRPVCWACAAEHWSKELAFELPSDSTMSTRLRTLGVQQLLERVLTAASELFPVTLVKAIDSKPLLVGAYSKDRDAKRGRIAAGQYARGYRLHVVTHGRAVQHWTLAAMNAHDSVAAPQLLMRLGGSSSSSSSSSSGSGSSGGGYVVADNAYDANELYDTASAANHQLVAPARPVNKGVRDLQRNGPARLRALDMLDSPLEHCSGGMRNPFGCELYNQREAVESCFGTMAIMGLNHLPAWVRGPRRVALWTASKILLYLCRDAKKKGLIT